LPAGIPKAVRDVVLRALDRDPRSRWPSAEAMGAAAATAALGHPDLPPHRAHPASDLAIAPAYSPGAFEQVTSQCRRAVTPIPATRVLAAAHPSTTARRQAWPGVPAMSDRRSWRVGSVDPASLQDRYIWPACTRCYTV